MSHILDRYLIIDADTVLLKNQYFSKKGVDILKFSDEFHFLYKISNKDILGNYLYSFKSFIAQVKLLADHTWVEI